MSHESEKARQNRLTRRERQEEEARQRREINKIWLWVGVVVLCVILLYWIFFIGISLGPNQ